MNQDPNQQPQTGVADTFPCKQCGGALAWDATKRAMKCPYCGFEQPMPVHAPHGAVQEIPIEEGYARAQRGLGVPVTTIQCKDCGATVNVGEGERTAACAFCGSKTVLQVETDANAIRPESLVAFQIDKANANQRFAEWLKGLWFRPNDLKRIAKVQEMGGVYVPFWTFDAHIDSDWTAEAGYHYYETEEYETVENGESVTRTRQVQYTRWEPAWGHRHDFYDDMLICASKGLPAELVSNFSTFNTKQLVPYAPHYLAGWRAESYAVDLMAAHGKARDKMSSEQVSRCARDVPGDTHRGLSVNNTFRGETFKHVLLPIWIAAYRYNNKVFRFLVNGQTGEVVGKAPWSFWKIFLFCLVIAAILGVVIFFVLQQQQEKQEKSKKKSDDSEQESPKKKKSKKKSSDDDGWLDPHRFRTRDGRQVVVPV